MLTTMVEHVIGIDPDRDRITASVVDTATTGEQASEVFEDHQGGIRPVVEMGRPAHPRPPVDQHRFGPMSPVMTNWADWFPHHGPGETEKPYEYWKPPAVAP